MEDQPGQYQKAVIKQYPAREQQETAESRYWRRFRAPVAHKQVPPCPTFGCCSTQSQGEQGLAAGSKLIAVPSWLSGGSGEQHRLQPEVPL